MLPNFSSINCRVHLYVDMLQFLIVSIFEAPLFKNVESPLNGDVSGVVGAKTNTDTKNETLNLPQQC